jgi:hypothetical protein
MEQPNYLAEINPSVHLVKHFPPPKATKLWLISKYGIGYAGIYSKEDVDIVAWSALPKMTKEQKAELRRDGYID